MNKDKTKYTLRLYRNEDRQAIPWMKEEIKSGRKSYLSALLEDGPTAFVKNVTSEFALLHTGERVLPCTISETEHDNSIVCSLYSHYILSGLDWLKKQKNSLKAKIVSNVLKTFGILLQSGSIDKTISVNNWLLSPNPAASLNSQEAAAIRAYLTRQFPDHAIVFRSIAKTGFDSSFESLEQNDFLFLVALNR